MTASSQSPSHWFVGIDVSAKTLDVAATDNHGNTRSLPKVANNSTGFKHLLKHFQKHLDGQVAWVCLESTGYYHREAANALCHQQIPVSVLNPRQVKGYATAQMQHNKTDKKDAALISQFAAHRGQSGHLHLYEPKTPAHQALYELVQQQHLYEKNLLAAENRLASLSSKQARKLSRGDIRSLKEKIQRVETLIEQVCTQEEEFAKNYELLQTIPGVAAKTAAAILAEGVHLMDDVKAACARYAMVPSQQQSGTSLKRSRLTSCGTRRLRTVLFHPTLSAIRYNPLVKASAKRLRANGKQGKKLVCACEHKLMRIICGVLINQKPFNPNILAERS